VVPKVAGSSPVDRPIFTIMMLCVSTFEAIILGILQGLTEFLPVSSSGHLVLGQAFLGLKHLENYLIFDLICHLGTVLAILCVFYRPLLDTLQKNRTRCLQILLGTLPLFPLALFLKPIKALFNQTELLGGFFMLTAFLLWLGMRFGSQARPEQICQHRWRDPLIIGLFQALALLPGVSRSGSTISGARLIGWNPSDAIFFSFLLAIPAILGGTVLEGLHLYLKSHVSILPSIPVYTYAAGFISAFISGCLALLLLIRLALKNQFMYFVWYCLGLGIVSTIYFNFL
jgi:undecaprenyl-diphosphatase